MQQSLNDIGKRSDVFLLEYLNEVGITNISRNFLQKNWSDFFMINQKQVKPSYKIRKHDIISIDIDTLQKIFLSQNSSGELKAQKENLDIMYEDDNY